MDVRKYYPEDIKREEDILSPIFFSRPQDETWEEFCKNYASERYNNWLKNRNERFEKNLKEGLIIN